MSAKCDGCGRDLPAPGTCPECKLAAEREQLAAAALGKLSKIARDAHKSPDKAPGKASDAKGGKHGGGGKDRGGKKGGKR